MLRARTLLPALLSTVAMPVCAGQLTVCAVAADAVGCLVEQSAVTDAFVSRGGRGARLEQAGFEVHQNDLATVSAIRVERIRSAQRARKARLAGIAAASKKIRQRQLEVEQNRLSAASVVRVDAERARQAAAAAIASPAGIAALVAAEDARLNDLTAAAAPCLDQPAQTPRCFTERAREFASLQNALSAASIARVAAERARRLAAEQNALATRIAARSNSERVRRQYAAAVSHCKYPGSEAPRCLAERAREFASLQNALSAEIAARAERLRVQRQYAAMTHCKSADDATPRCTAERARIFARQQNALATRSAERVNAVRARAFAAARNREIERSIAAVAEARRITTASIEPPQQKQIGAADCRSVGYSAPGCSFNPRRDAEIASLTTHCKGPGVTPRCEAERARQQADALLTTHCKGSSVTPRCAAERARQQALAVTHCKSAADTSPRCEAERERNFAAERNAEIERSIRAVENARAEKRAAADTGAATTTSGLTSYGDATSPLETGALGSSVLPQPAGPTPAQDLKLEHHGMKRSGALEPCREAAKPFGPLQYISGARVTDEMKAELDKVVVAAQSCPGMRVEIHGHAAGIGAAYYNRNLAQARADAAVDYLIANGVSPNRLAAIGLGAEFAELPYSRAADGTFSRRAEIVVKDPANDAAARRVMWDLAELLDPTYIPAVAGLSP